MQPELIRDALIRNTDEGAARRRMRDIRPLRGVRGVPDGEVARILAATWRDDRPNTDEIPAIAGLFSGAFEDGLVAIGLVAALVPDAAAAALEVGVDWLGQVDDVLTADAIGWLVLGPAAATEGTFADVVLAGREREHPCARRAVAAMGLALLPEPVSGPCAAALRERLGERQIRFVEAPVADGLAFLLDASVRDPSPEVQKVVYRLVRTWSRIDLDAAAGWADRVRGGIPRALRDELAPKKEKRR